MKIFQLHMNTPQRRRGLEVVDDVINVVVDKH